MYINDVISYLGAWEKIKIDHPKVCDDINLLLKLVKSRIFEMYGDLEEDNKWEKPPIGNFIRIEVENNLFDLGWINKSFNIDERAFINNLGVSKDNCFVKAGLSGASANLSVMSWIFSEINYASRITEVSIPVLLLFSISTNLVKEYLDGKNTNTHKNNKLYSINTVKKNLERISPLKVEQPFLILGIGLNELQLQVIEINQDTSINNEKNIKIDRCITFERLCCTKI
ncbi:hypothetical protein [Acinetobacter venetianus]|uniref:hypothetical protein n=1 Tax=Acinetobacter venetianus TaxID=52133 RepID=UPI00289DE38B|nr:hypothetical protein [Acinetobacter venetianus]